MLDPKLLRSDLPGVAAALARRGFVLDVAAFAALEERRKAVQIEADRLRAERNANAKAVGQAKAKGQDASSFLALGESLGQELHGSRQAARGNTGAGVGPAIGLAQYSARERSRRTRRDGERRSEAMGHRAAIRVRPEGPRRIGRADWDGFRSGGAHLRSTVRGDDGKPGEASPGSRAIHARSAYPRSRVSGSLRALPGAPRGAGRHGAITQVRTGFVCGARRSWLLLDSHGRSAGDEPGSRPNTRTGDAAAEVHGAHALLSIGGRARPARTLAA